MQYLSDNQLIYRAYLASPLWAKKRLEALGFYGSTCMRCGEWGNDVHHKTYDRVGGNELMDDFEILCRDCHKAHHRVAKRVSTRHNKVRGIHRRAIFGSLSLQMKIKLSKEFGISQNELYSAIIAKTNEPLVINAIKMLGCQYVFGYPKKYAEPIKKKMFLPYIYQGVAFRE